jgi:glutaminase
MIGPNITKLEGDTEMEKSEQVLRIVQDFIRKQEISCSESVYQSDRVIENAYKLIEDLCNVVGYYDYDTEDLKEN